jgi:hypothetical protein
LWAQAFVCALVMVGASACYSTAQPSPAAVQAAPGAFEDHHFAMVLLEDKAHPAIRHGRTLWGAHEALTYHVGGLDSGETITVPAGFVTDLASIPRPVWALLPPDGPWAKAAVVHDFLYRTGGTGRLWGEVGVSRHTPYSRAEADNILRGAMASLQVPWIKRQIIWIGVRIGGGPGFVDPISPS